MLLEQRERVREAQRPILPAPAPAPAPALAPAIAPIGLIGGFQELLRARMIANLNEQRALFDQPQPQPQRNVYHNDDHNHIDDFEWMLDAGEFDRSRSGRGLLTTRTHLLRTVCSSQNLYLDDTGSPVK